MDPQILLIGVAVFVLSALLIYLISVFGIKEKTFEEAIAEQRSRLDAEKKKARDEKKAEKDKKKKKPKEKPKEKTTVVEPEEKPIKMLNLEIDPEIIEPLDRIEVKKTTPRKRQPKPILHNKDEEPVIAKETQNVIHSIPPPKDELELLHERTKESRQEREKEPQAKAKDTFTVVKAQKGDKQAKETKAAKKIAPVEEEIVLKNEVRLQSSPVKDTKRAATTSAVVTPSQLFDAVNSTNLQDSDIESLIDVLLNKQGTSFHSKKPQKNDPMALLKKQLEEKERAFQEEQKLAMQANASLAKEKANYTNLEKQYQEKIAVQNQDIQALRAKMQHSMDQHMVERSSMQSRLQQLELQVGDQSVVHKLGEENKLLKDTVERMKSETVSQKDYDSLNRQHQIVQSELSKNVIKINASENAKKSLETRLAEQTEELKKLRDLEKESEGTFAKRMEEVNKQLRKSEMENGMLTNSLQAAEKECASFKGRLQELEQALSANVTKELEEKLKGAEMEKSTIQVNLKDTEKKLAEIEQNKSKLEKDYKNISNEKSELEAKLKSYDDRLNTMEQQKSQLNKDLESSEKDRHSVATSLKTLECKVAELEQNKTKLEKEVQDLQKVNTNLSKEIEVTKSELVSAKDEVKVVKEIAVKTAGAPNGDIHDETPENKITIDQHEKIVSEKEIEIKRLITDVEGKSSEVCKLQEDLEKQRKKNNELREKNWKVMDALQNAEKSQSEKVSNVKEQNVAAITETETQDKGVLQRLFPTISVNEKLAHKDWMTDFEKEATLKLSSLSQQSESSAKVKDLEGTVTQLETQLQQYKSSSAKFKDLEGTVSQLETQLQQYKSSSAKFDSKAKELETQKKNLENQLQQLQTQVSNSADSSSQLNELQVKNQKLESQVQEYLQVLSITESKLQQLENSVEGEEKKWQEKVQSLHLDVEQAKQENSSLKEEVEKAKQSTEMKEKVLSLEGQLKISEDKCSQLQRQVDESQERISSLRVQVEKTQSAETDISDLLKQIEELKKKMEEEMKKSKELASTNVRLNGIIKTGQDSLKQEQDLVEKLKTELENNKGSSSGTSDDVKELKAKLEEKEKQLEKELQAKKQLSQRLVLTENEVQ